MSNENKKPKSKATMLTLLVCIVAVLSGKPISEVLTEVSSSQETIATEQTVDYDYEESIEETVEAVIEEDAEDVQTVAGTDTNEETTYVEENTTNAESATEEEEKEAGNTDTQEVAGEETAEEDEDISFSEPEVQISDHKFRSKKLLNDHYKKHGLEMGFESAEEYVENANRVISSPDVLYKLEEEDNDHVYYLEETNEFVVVSQDGYIRTYFNPSAGIDYFNRQ